MALTLNEVEHIADLARLELTAEEKERFRDQLSTILGHFASLQQPDTSDVPPTATVLPLRNIMRKDEVRPSLSPEDALANAPDESAGCFRVRAILE